MFDAIRVGSLLQGSARYDRYARPLATEVLALRAAGALKISHRLHLRAEICSDTLPDELAEFSPADDVGIVSLMDHTPGQRQFRDINKLAGYVMARHQLTKGQFADHVAQLQALSARVAVGHRAVALAEAARIGAVLASHDDSDLAQVAASALAGMRLAEFPATIEAAQAFRDHGIAVMAGAPNLIRGGSHAGNLAAGALADAGLIDIISSDYVPAALLNAALVPGDRWGDMARAVATVTASPAAAAGLADRGRIWPGLRGDVIRVARVSGAAAVRGVWVAGNRVA